jgi:ABC-type transport system involved in multi-copper enzyme maturation permease subunit
MLANNSVLAFVYSFDPATVTLLVIAVFLAVVAGYVLVGLFQARSLVRRELAAYFVSPIAYVVLVVFLAVTGHLFYMTLQLLTAKGPVGTAWPMQSMFANERFWFVFLFIPPILTMRLFAEERSSGTLEVLMTSPLRDWQLVLSKYAACLAFYTVMWLPTLAYLPALLGADEPVFSNSAWTVNSILLVAGLGAMLLGLLFLWLRLGTTGRLISLGLVGGGAVATGIGGWRHYALDPTHVLEWHVALDPAPVLSTYIGIFFAGAMLLAMGLLVSSLVRDQLVAALISLALSLVFIVAGFWRPEPDNPLYSVVYFFSVPLHFDRTFTRGMIDTRPLVLYGSVALFCLFLTVKSLEARRRQ